MKTSGKIILFLLVMIVNLFGGVTASVDKANVIEGDSVTLSITANGQKVIFPDITSIDGDNINGIGNSQNISIINGNYQKTLTKTYIFTPSHSLTIPSYKVKIDGKEYHTKPIQIKVVKDKATNKNFKLELETKKEAILNYPNPVTIRFYQKTNATVDQISLELPKGDFELKQIGNEKTYFKGVYKVSEIQYFLIPHKNKDIDFNIKVKLGFAKLVVDAFGFPMQQMRYRVLEKSQKIKIKKLYDGLIGDFKISLKVDKKKIKANQPLNGELVIKGEGDLTNLSDIKFSIPNVTMYDNKPKIETTIKNGKIYSVYRKSFVILGDNSYTIPPIELKYFNIHHNKVESIKTDPIKIEIIQNKNSISSPSPASTIANLNSSLTETDLHKKKGFNYLYLIFSFVIGVVTTLVGVWLFSKKETIKLPTNLYNKLLPYADNPEIKTILEKLYNKEKLSKEEKNFIKEFLKGKIS